MEFLNGGRQREGENRIRSSWKEATNTAFEISVMHPVLFMAVTLVWLGGFLRFHLLN